MALSGMRPLCMLPFAGTRPACLPLFRCPARAAYTRPALTCDCLDGPTACPSHCLPIPRSSDCLPIPRRLCVPSSTQRLSPRAARSSSACSSRRRPRAWPRGRQQTPRRRGGRRAARRAAQPRPRPARPSCKAGSHGKSRPLRCQSRTQRPRGGAPRLPSRRRIDGCRRRRPRGVCRSAPTRARPSGGRCLRRCGQSGQEVLAVCRLTKSLVGPQTAGAPLRQLACKLCEARRPQILTE
jgi:hypothetical protein